VRVVRNVGIPSRGRPYWTAITGWARADRGGGSTEQAPTETELTAAEAAAAGDGSLADTLLLEAVAASTRTGRGRGEQDRSAPPVRSRKWLVHRMLLLADVVGLMGAFVLTAFLLHQPSISGHVDTGAETLLFVLLLPAWVVAAKLHGLYDNDREHTDHTTADDLVGVVHVVALGMWFFVFASWATGWAHPSVPSLLVFSLLAIAFVPVARALARTAARRSPLYVQNAVIVGAGMVGAVVARKLRNHPEYGIRVVGYVDSDPVDAALRDPAVPLLGDISELPQLVEPLNVDRVVVAFSRDGHDEMLRALRLLRTSHVQVDIVPRLFEVVGPNARIRTVEGLPLVGWPPAPLSRSSRLAKRLMDLVLAMVGLVVLAPVLALTALLIKLDSPGPALFRQVRMGAGKTFRIFKFRTMRIDAEDMKEGLRRLNVHLSDDPRMFKVVDDPRVTRVGRFLRRFALDELPQLLNVLHGEMSLVGPRPLILEEDHYVQDWARARLHLKPGITGMWQVLGASDIPFDEMTRLDYLYVTNWSLWGDFRLIVRTLPALARARRAY
jgi:exopolysaccharide biosynthesis polyprenyl glycosylphosphotransferase